MLIQGTGLIGTSVGLALSSAGWTVHLRQLAGTNTHHIIEAAFKAFGRALAQAVAHDPRVKGVPSTKGIL